MNYWNRDLFATFRDLVSDALQSERDISSEDESECYNPHEQGTEDLCLCHLAQQNLLCKFIASNENCSLQWSNSL